MLQSCLFCLFPVRHVTQLFSLVNWHDALSHVLALLQDSSRGLTLACEAHAALGHTAESQALMLLEWQYPSSATVEHGIVLTWTLHTSQGQIIAPWKDQ